MEVKELIKDIQEFTSSWSIGKIEAIAVGKKEQQCYFTNYDAERFFSKHFKYVFDNDLDKKIFKIKDVEPILKLL